MFFEKREVKTLHTVAIWTFTFHKKSGCVKVIWKANFKTAYSHIHELFVQKIEGK